MPENGDTKEQKRRQKIASQLGRRGGQKGGKARWKGISKAERSTIMKRVSQAAPWRKPIVPSGS